MKIGTMFQDVIQSILKKPVTRKYPVERTPAPPRLRGKLIWDPEKCTGCCLCTKDCPADAIEIITIDKKEKRFVMRYHEERCIYCGQCEASCRQGCIDMSDEDWELAAQTQEPFEVIYGEDTDVETFLANLASGRTET